MKNLIQNNSNADQSNTEVRKSQKHDANLQKNSTLYFQVGLILCLLGTFALLEMQFTSKDYVYDPPEINDEIIEYAMSNVKVYQEEAPKEEKILQKRIIDDVVEIDDNATDELLENLITEPTPTSSPVIDHNTLEIEPVIEDDVHINFVQFVPIYPGCEKYKKNSKRAKCLNDKIGKLVRRKFNTDIASEEGLNGTQVIYVQFKVNKNGEVTDIQTRAPHPKLREEAQRTVNIIPKMKPGKMGDKPVNVIYTLPIKFKVEN